MNRSEFVDLLGVIHCFRDIAEKNACKLGYHKKKLENTKTEISPILETLSQVIGFNKLELVKIQHCGATTNLFAWPVDGVTQKMSKSIVAKIKQFKFRSTEPVRLTYQRRSDGACDYYFCKNGSPCVFVFTADQCREIDVELLERVLLIFDYLIEIFDVNKDPDFTDRELEVMDLVIKGKTNCHISEILNISERTVKFHVSNIFQKMNIESRVELVGKVYAHNTNAIN